MKNKHKLTVVTIVLSLLTPALSYTAGWAENMHCGLNDTPGINCPRHDDGLNYLYNYAHMTALAIIFFAVIFTLIVGSIRVYMMFVTTITPKKDYDPFIGWWGEQTDLRANAVREKTRDF